MEPFPSKPLESSDGHQTISPVRARVAFAGQSDMLWKNCDTLVNRMCRLESVVQTLKLNMFRLQTDKELNPKHAGTVCGKCVLAVKLDCLLPSCSTLFLEWWTVIPKRVRTKPIGLFFWSP